VGVGSTSDDLFSGAAGGVSAEKATYGREHHGESREEQWKSVRHTGMI
jgi:hypothetical protein